MTLGTGVPLYIPNGVKLSWDDPNNQDSDGDNLKDGDEVSISYVENADGTYKVWVAMTSNPCKKDSDGDGYTDDEDENPLKRDTKKPDDSNNNDDDEDTHTDKGRYAGINPPDEVHITKADIDADIAKGLYTRADYDALLSISGEADTYEGFYAVACCVRNRVQNMTAFRNLNTYKDVTSAKKQFKAYDQDYSGNDDSIEPCIRNAAVALLRGGHSTVSNYCYFFGIETGYDLWFRSERQIAINNPPIVIGAIDKYHRNVYHAGPEVGKEPANYVHNKNTNKSEGPIILFDSTTGKWYDQQ